MSKERYDGKAIHLEHYDEHEKTELDEVNRFRQAARVTGDD
jgi:hypothetical protein